MRAVNLVENYLKMKSILSFIIFFCISHIHAQNEKFMEHVDTLIVLYKKDNSFYKLEVSKTGSSEEDDQCLRYILKFKDTIQSSSITFTNCYWWENKEKKSLRVHRNWMKNKPLLDKDFFQNYGFLKSLKEIRTLNRIFYVYDEVLNTPNSDTLQLIEVKMVSNSLRYE